MKTLYFQLVGRLVRLLSFVVLIQSGDLYGQVVPPVQWQKAGSTTVALPDGNLAASIGNIPVGQISAQGVVKYNPAGDVLWTRVPTEYTFVGRIGLGYTPLQTIGSMEATTSGGLTLYGVEYGTGQRVIVVLDANGENVNAFPFPSATGISLTVEDLTATPDGGFVVVGTSFVTGDGTHKDTFVYKYDSGGKSLWATRISSPNANPTATDYSITSAKAVINASDGGYLLVGYYSPNGPPNTIPPTDFDPVTANARAWVAKVEGNGNLAWQKVLTGLPLEFVAGAPAPGSIATLHTLTDGIPAADGNGYTVVGAGRAPSSVTVPAAQTALLELNPDGTYKRGRLLDASAGSARLKRYPSAGATYYAIGHSDAPPASHGKVEILLVDPVLLNAIVARGTFDSPSHTPINALVLAGDVSLAFSTGREVFNLQVDKPSVTLLTLTEPYYDCTTRTLDLKAEGVTGDIPVAYRIVGLRDWNPSPNFVVPAWQRTGTTFNMEVRQGNRVASRWFTTRCDSSPPSAGFALLAPLYDCNTGQLTLQTAGGDRSVQFRVLGLRDWDASPVFTVPAWQRVGTTFTLEARLGNGQTANWTFVSSCEPTPPAQTLRFAAPTLDCNGGDGSAQLSINLAGIAADPNGGIEYKIPGLADWQTRNTFTVPNYQANGTTFTLYVRWQSSPVEYTTQFTTTCSLATRKGVDETGNGLEAVLYPNPVGEQFTVEVRGAAWQSVRFELSDALGRSVHSQRTTVTENHHRETIRLAQAPAGMYLLRVATPQQAVTLKVLKP